MKSFLGYVTNKIVQSLPRSKKVSPDIKFVKPTKDISGSVKRTKSDEYIKRIRILEGAEKKIKSGKEMIKEGQKARKNMIDTKRAFQFKHGKSTHAIKPGDKPEVKYKGNVKEQKATGGRVGRKFGGGMDMGRRKTNVEKIKETFAAKSKKKNLKPVDKKKNPGLAKLPIEVRNKMGYAKKGGRA
jgi:hypothetical protein